MNKKNLRRPSALAVVIAVALSQLVAQVVLADNIDPTNKWASGATVAGSTSPRPSVGTDTSYAAAVYADHLEGYAWGENIGWIHLGTYAGAGAHTYGNTSNSDYGVNGDANGNLLGFAWSSSVGWLKLTQHTVE